MVTVPKLALMVFIGVLGCCAAASAQPVSETRLSDSQRAQELIEALTDRDPEVRQNATEALAEMGPAARPLLLEAARSDDPEQRSRAAQIVLQLPWDRTDDPPPVRDVLREYGNPDERHRARVVQKIAGMGHLEILLRLLKEEPADMVRWRIVAHLVDKDEPVLSWLRELEAREDDAPVLYALGQAWFVLDPPRGLDLLRKTLEAHARRPSTDMGLLDWAYHRLIRAKLQEQDFNGAAEILREQISRQLNHPRRAALAALIALHHHFGPLDGFEQDLRHWAKDDAEPELADAVAELMQQLGAGPLPRRDAGSIVGLVAEERVIGAYFLFQHDWHDAAELEIQAAKAAPAENRDEVDVHFHRLLAMIEGKRGNDESAANHLEQMILVKTRTRLHWSLSDDDIWAEMHWRRARAATERGDTAAADRNVELLLQFAPANTDSAIEMINWLRDNDRADASGKLFAKVYDLARAKVDAHPDEPVWKNDLAWLCARCDQRLEEALELATAAVAARPQSAAFIDTLAEVHFRMGNADEAVRLEIEALKYRPHDEFMQQQLERFRGKK